MKVQKKFKESTTLKEFVEEMKKDGCQGITKINKLENGDHEINYEAEDGR